MREQFEQGVIEPWQTKEMPDLAIIITQILLASTTLEGAHPEQALYKVPYKDFVRAIADILPMLMLELNTDTRNVLLTLARIWTTLVTDEICSKPAAADWVINRLPEEYRLILKQAKAVCKGEEEDQWNNRLKLIKPCADFMLSEIKNEINTIIILSQSIDRPIRIS